MENPSRDETVIFKVRNMCCIYLQKQLKKELWKVDGVKGVAINPEKGYVSVIGKVDEDLLVNAIAKTGLCAEKLLFNNNTKNNEYQHHAEEFRHSENAYNKHQYGSSSKQDQKYRCQENNRHKFKEEEEEEHKCEDYVPPPIDEQVCRDFYCKSHRMRPIFRNSMPGSGGYGYFGHFPHHGRMRGHPWHQPGPRWFGGKMPPSAYGFHAGRPMPGYDGYGFYGDESGCRMDESGCRMM